MRPFTRILLPENQNGINAVLTIFLFENQKGDNAIDFVQC